MNRLKGGVYNREVPNMRNLIFWTVSAIGYFVFIIWNVYKLRDISRNPQKYEKVKGRERYRESFWYEPGYERYGKHYHACLILGIPGFITLLVLLFAAMYLIQRYLLIPSDTMYLYSVGLGIGLCAALFFAISLLQYIFFLVNKPIFVAARLYSASSNNYVKAWRDAFLWLMVLGVICLPVMIIGINASNYADEEKIVTHGVFSLQEREIPYDAVVSGETSYSYDEEDDNFSFRYTIVLADGTKLEVCDFGMEGACYIDTMLQKHGVAISYGVIDADTFELLKSVCREKTLPFVEQCFIINRQ